MIHAYAGVIDATLIDVEIVHFISFFFVSRFKKRGITTLRGGVLGLVAPVGSGSLSLARLVRCYAVALDCCDTQAFWLSG